MNENGFMEKIKCILCKFQVLFAKVCGNGRQTFITDVQILSLATVRGQELHENMKT